MEAALLVSNTTNVNPPRNSVDEEETEDEEVKMNCIGGNCGMQESDFSESDNDLSRDDDIQEDQGHDGVVEFSSGKLQPSESGPPLYRPKPVACLPRLSPHAEDPDENSSESSESCSVGARGAPLSLGGSNDGDESSGDDDESMVELPEEESAAPDAENEEDESFEVSSDVDEKLPAEQPSILQQLEFFSNKLASLGQGSEDRKQKPKSKAKRVLSSNTLAALNAEAGRNADSPKRMRSSPLPSTPSERLPKLSLGLSAMDQIRPLPRHHLMRDSPVMSSDEEDLDKRLTEELERRLRWPSGDNSPVPLLTPPQSPLTIEVGEEGTTEWPSNLVVDSAMMTAATFTRPLSPTSLQKFEEAEEERLSKESDKFANTEASSLTSLLRSIYVGID